MNVALRRPLRGSKVALTPTRTLQGTERPSHVCISQDNQIEKSSPDKCALSRAEGRFYVSLSLSDGDAEGRL